MVKIFIQVIIFLTAELLCMGNLFADDSTKAEKLERLLDLSGVTEQILQFPKAMKYSIEQIYELGQCDENSFHSINAAIDSNIITQSMKEIVLTDLMLALDESEIDEQLVWYNSPTGEKIAYLEKQSSSPKAYEEMRKSSSRLFSNRKNVAQAQDIDKILQATDWAVNVQMQSTIAMLGGLAQIQHKNITDSLIKLASQLDQQKLLLKPQVEKSITLWYLYTYQNLNNSEMASYRLFLKNPKTQSFSKKSLNSLAHAITQVVENFIVSIETKSIDQKNLSSDKINIDS